MGVTVWLIRVPAGSPLRPITLWMNPFLPAQLIKVVVVVVVVVVVEVVVVEVIVIRVVEVVVVVVVVLFPTVHAVPTSGVEYIERRVRQ